MAANTGNQTVTLLYHNRADSSVINRRFINIRKTGIYSGGYPTKVDNIHVRLSTLTCEISDGTYQVKISTGSTVTIVVGTATPYVVLRWVYTGDETADYMSILAVATPATNDLVIAECTFTGGGNLQGFDYTERTTPNTQDLFLKVEPTEDTELRVRIRAGRVQGSSGFVFVPDQPSNLFTVPTSNSKVYLVYINPDTGVVSIDSTGTAAASPVAPNYKGKLVLAEVTLSSTSTNITADMIRDVRPFLTLPSASVYASMTNPTPQSIPSGVTTTLVYSTSVVDSTGNIVDLANNRLKPDIAGWYNVSAVIGLENVEETKQGVVFYLRRNGVCAARVSQYPANVAGTPDPAISISTLLYFNGSTDYVDIAVYHNNGSALNTFSAGSFYLHKV